jgi:hypothetical protein
MSQHPSFVSICEDFIFGKCFHTIFPNFFFRNLDFYHSYPLFCSSFANSRWYMNTFFSRLDKGNETYLDWLMHKVDPS